MSSGMNLEELRATLETDAQKRCLVQEQTIRDLHLKVKRMKDELAEKDRMIDRLDGRLYNLSNKKTCLFCRIKRFFINTITKLKGE